MPRILIIGYGNTLRGDDGFGFLAAKRLREAIRHPEIEVIALHQLTPELMEPISRAGRVLFIDARVEGEPGQLRFEPVEPEGESAGRFTHFSTPGALLAGAWALYGSAARATMAGAAGADFGVGETLSPAMQRALAKVIGPVREWIDGALSASEP
jgi:hydrogenase maturation protease